MVLLAAVVFSGISFLTTPVVPVNHGFDFDGTFYGAMAGSRLVAPEFARFAPWCYRVLTPALVRLLPGDTLDGFRFLNVLSDIGCFCLIFSILTRIASNGRNELAWIGTLLWAGVFWTVKFSLYSPAYIDAQTELFLLALVRLTLSARPFWLVPAFALAALQKESLAAFTIFSAAYLLRARGASLSRSTIALAAAIVAAPLASLGIVHAFVHPSYFYSATQATRQELTQLLDVRFWPVLIQSVFSGLGLLPAVLVARPAASIEFLRRRPEWIVYGCVSLVLLFGGIDKARLFIYALPLTVILAIRVADDLYPVRGTRFASWAVLTVLAQLYVGNYLTPVGAYQAYLAKLVPEHSGEAYVGYLMRNLVIAGLFVVLTLVTTKGAWAIARSIGFSGAGSTDTSDR